MKCNICGKDEASNHTWSNETICDDCVNWIDIFMNNVNQFVYEDHVTCKEV
jgi:transcription initiation factor TFIIIB Brf1 subunit/transcription initiation factor TFIIB